MHPPDEENLPSVTVVISLHNEEDLVAKRIENLQTLAYPKEKIEIVLGDDCSSDRTRPIIRERMAVDPRIRLVEFDEHQGKTAIINALVPQCRGDIIAFSDANTLYDGDAVRRMARGIMDRKVGSVCGRPILRSGTGINPDDEYWQYETMIKMRENDLGVVLGANGGIYMIRKELFQPLESRVIQIDDFIWPVRVYEKGYHGVYEPQAIAYEESAPTVEAEFRRKVRIGTGDYRALVECRRLLVPWKGWIAFAFWSHKVLRWCVPFPMLTLFFSNARVRATTATEFFVIQSVFYLCAGICWTLSGQKHGLARLFRLPYYCGQQSRFAHRIHSLRDRQQAAWTQKTHRPC